MSDQKLNRAQFMRLGLMGLVGTAAAPFVGASADAATDPQADATQAQLAKELAEKVIANPWDYV